MATSILERPTPALRTRVSPHQRLVIASILISVAIIAALVWYGFDYYWMSAADRPFSPKHLLLKPSGSVGIKLGVLGLAMFCAIFLYPLRKKIRWLARRGSAQNWLDFHIVLGTVAPVIIAFHASFKFQGIAGMAFWIMVSVALSGIVGRYLYAQIPQSLNAAELSLKELEAIEKDMASEFATRQLFSGADLEAISRVPGVAEVRGMPVFRALGTMMMLDLARPFRVARLRRQAVSGVRAVLTAGGLLPSGNTDLERIVGIARRRSTLAKRVAFLARTQQVFHLWHVIHRPFSYSFAVLAILHIAVVIALGYL